MNEVPAISVIVAVDGRSTGHTVEIARAKDLGVAMAVVPRVVVIKYVHSTNLSLTAPDNDRSLLTLLRESIRRRRGQSVVRTLAGS